MKNRIKVDAKGHGVVQRDFMTMDLSVYAKCVYTLLRTYQGDKHSCYPSLKTICEDLRISKSTVIRAIKDLEDINMVAVRRSKKIGKNENSVNVYIPLSVQIEIDLEKVDLEDNNEGLGGTPQTPRGTPQTLGVVSEIDRKNNIIKNNKEENLNINKETSSFCGDQQDLFGMNEPEVKSKPKTKAKPKKESDVHPSVALIKKYWFDEFRISDRPTTQNGWAVRISKIKEIVKKIDAHVLGVTGDHQSPEYILDFFKQMCMACSVSNNTFYSTIDLNNIDAKFSGVIELTTKTLKQINHGKSNSQAGSYSGRNKDGSTNFKFNFG